MPFHIQTLQSSQITIDFQVLWTPVLGPEYAIKIDRKNNVLRMHVNGSLAGQASTIAASVPNYAAGRSIGAGNIQPAGCGFNGEISCMKITVG